jgi:YgiT-type zinc finger domain-containing protein
MTSESDYRCPYCGGRVTHGHLVTYTDDSSEPVVIVRGVPAQVCRQCGEHFFDSDVAAQLSRLAREARAGREGQEGVAELRYPVPEKA